MAKDKRWVEYIGVVLALVLLILIALRVFSVTKEYRESGVLGDKIDVYLEDQDFSGIVLVSDERGVIFYNAYGNATADTAYMANTFSPFFSLTKQFTGYGILLLEKQGKLSRKDKLSKYFEDCAYGDQVTLEDLLDMTSGIPEYVANEDVMGEDIDTAVLEGMDRQVLLERILQLKPEGYGEYKYSNSNYFLLGKVIELTSGESYEEFLQKEVLMPAGIQEVRFDPQNTQTMGMDGEGILDGREYHASITFGAGDVCGMIMHLHEWQDYVFSELSEIDMEEEFRDVEGFHAGWDKEGEIFSRTGGGIYHRNYMLYDTEKRLQVILLSNCSKTDAGRLGMDLWKIVMEYLEES